MIALRYFLAWNRCPCGRDAELRCWLLRDRRDPAVLDCLHGLNAKERAIGRWRVLNHAHEQRAR